MRELISPAIHLAICDDEPYMLDSLAAQLSQYMEEKNLPFHIHRFSSGRSLLESREAFDIVFLDIQMKKPDGMAAARLLRKKGYSGMIIFLTVLKEKVFDSFEVQAFDYLVKPLDRQRLSRTMDRAVKNLEQESRKKLFVKKGTACQLVPFSQILYCEVYGRKIYIHQTNGETLDYYHRMDNLEKQLDRRFFRCHRSYLVNLDYVQRCQNRLIRLSVQNHTDGTPCEIPVSRQREPALTQAILTHMKGRQY